MFLRHVMLCYYTVRNRNRLIYTLLSVKNSYVYNLRHRRHDRTLASNHDQRNFIDRHLHKQLLLTISSSHSLLNCVLFSSYY